MSSDMTPVARYAEFVAVEGYRPTIDEDFVVFKVEGDTFLIQTFADDESYVRLAKQFRVTGDKLRCLEAANSNNERFKGVKSTYDHENGAVAFTLEAFYNEPEQLQPHFSRILALLSHASDEFFASIREVESESRT